MSQLLPPELDPSFDVVDFLAPGTSVDLTTCDREPIHRSGMIQPHGVLFAVGETDMVIRHASTNVQAHMGVDGSDLLGELLAGALGEDAVSQLRTSLEDPRASGTSPLLCSLPNDQAYEMTWHRVSGMVIVELEPASSGDIPMAILLGRWENAMRIMETTEGVVSLCNAAAGEFKQVTGYDRVMVYRFHPDWHGEVIAERCEPDMEPFLGLHYPASDIPRQARKLYLLNRLRVIADVGYEPVRILAATGAEPLNLSFSDLRSISPMHLAYLTNMGVGATLTISLMSGTYLWGMVACHHRSPKHVNAQLRNACRLLGQKLSLRVVLEEKAERDEYADRLAALREQLVADIDGAVNLTAGLVASGPAATAITGADGLIACIDRRTVTVGTVPPPEAVKALLARLCGDEEPSELICNDLPHRFVELAPFADAAAGVLAIPVSGGYNDYLLWFRGEKIHSMDWAGDPEKPMIGDPTSTAGASAPGHLRPRVSFASWTQEIMGCSDLWLEAEIEAARGLATAIPELQLTNDWERMVTADPIASLERMVEISAFDFYSAEIHHKFDGVARRAAEMMDLPVGMVCIVLDTAEYWAGTFGVDGSEDESMGTAIEWSFSAGAVRTGKPYLVPDASASRLYSQSPLVADRGFHCYAGVPLETARGQIIGALSVIGTSPRTFSPDEIATLTALSGEVIAEIERHRII